MSSQGRGQLMQIMPVLSKSPNKKPGIPNELSGVNHESMRRPFSSL